MSKNNLAPAIDRLGIIMAQLAALKIEEKELKAVMLENGPGEYEGDLYRVTVSIYDRTDIDWEAIAAKLNPSHQLVTAHTHTKKGQSRVGVKARTGKIKVPA